MEFLTLQSDQKNGIRMRSDVYNAIMTEILAVLEHDEGMPSPLFFGILHDRFVSRLGENTGWYVYQVKLDMEARGLIKSQYIKRQRNTKTLIKIVRTEVKRARVVTKTNCLS